MRNKRVIVGLSSVAILAVMIFAVSAMESAPDKEQEQIASITATKPTDPEINEAEALETSSVPVATIETIEATDATETTESVEATESTEEAETQAANKEVSPEESTYEEPTEGEAAESTENVEETDAPRDDEVNEQPNHSESEQDNGYLGRFTLTAYCSCVKCCGEYALSRPIDENGNPIVYTASGAIAKTNHTIAVDPSIIPYGTAVMINGITYVAEDCGGGVNGNHIDVYFDNHEDAWNFGRQSADVYLVG